jgi:hypothetical protein
LRIDPSSIDDSGDSPRAKSYVSDWRSTMGRRHLYERLARMPAALRWQTARPRYHPAMSENTDGDTVDTGTSVDANAQDKSTEEIRTWWRRSPALAALAALAIGLGTLWFAGMLGRVPLDSHATIGYLLMLPLLLIVPAFSAAGLRLAWLGMQDRSRWRTAIVVAAIAGSAANIVAIGRFFGGLLRIFTT